jgi:hypothetical protein
MHHTVSTTPVQLGAAQVGVLQAVSAVRVIVLCPLPPRQSALSPKPGS